MPPIDAPQTSASAAIDAWRGGTDGGAGGTLVGSGDAMASASSWMEGDVVSLVSLVVSCAAFGGVGPPERPPERDVRVCACCSVADRAAELRIAAASAVDAGTCGTEDSVGVDGAGMISGDEDSGSMESGGVESGDVESGGMDISGVDSGGTGSGGVNSGGVVSVTGGGVHRRPRSTDRAEEDACDMDAWDDESHMEPSLTRSTDRAEEDGGVGSPPDGLARGLDAA